MKVPVLTLVMMGVDILLGIGLFVGLFFFLRHRYHKSMVPFAAGCITFILFALVLEAAVHRIILPTPAGIAIQSSIWLYGLYGGLMAGIFEETGRLAAMTLLKKKYAWPETGLIYGAGHGGIEVILVMVLSMVNYLVYAVMFNAGTLEQLLAPLDQANQAALMGIVQSLCTGNPFSLLLSPLERVSAVILQMALSVLVWKAVTAPGKIGLYFIAILLHAAMDFFAVVFSSMGPPALILELVLLLIALASAAFAGKIYRQ